MEWIPGAFLPSSWRGRNATLKWDMVPEPPIWCDDHPATTALPRLPISCAAAASPQESEWSARKRRSGAVCRLVEYKEGDKPSCDIFLEGGAGKPFVVSRVKEHGKAFQSGVRKGDRLTSIDGAKDFLHFSAIHVIVTLRPPVSLVFIGFEGVARSEVRLHSSNEVCGVPPAGNAILRLDSFKMCEETVFDPGRASLFFEVPQARPSWPRQTSMFELRQKEACWLVQQARDADKAKKMHPPGSRDSCAWELPRDLAAQGDCPKGSPRTERQHLHTTVADLWASRMRMQHRSAKDMVRASSVLNPGIPVAGSAGRPAATTASDADASPETIDGLPSGFQSGLPSQPLAERCPPRLRDEDMTL